MCEYIMFVLEKCQPTPFRGRWEARVLESRGMRKVDTGVCKGAINIDPPPEGHWMLQEAINRWRQQAYIHAIVESPVSRGGTLRRMNLGMLYISLSRKLTLEKDKVARLKRGIWIPAAHCIGDRILVTPALASC